MPIPAQEVVLPLCPHCKQELPEVKIIMWGAIGGVLCPHCRVLLHCQMFAALLATQTTGPEAGLPSLGARRPS